MVKAEFRIKGKDIDVKEITNLLKLRPTIAFNRNDEGVPLPISKRKGVCGIETKYEASPDSCKQLRKLTRKLLPKIEELKQIKEKWKCDFIFSIVIEIYGSQCPAVSLDPNDIEFFHEIGAFYDVDIYYMGGYEDEDTHKGE